MESIPLMPAFSRRCRRFILMRVGRQPCIAASLKFVGKPSSNEWTERILVDIKLTAAHRDVIAEAHSANRAAASTHEVDIQISPSRTLWPTNDARNLSSSSNGFQALS